MAYSQPTDVRQTRDRAAVTTMLWREQAAKQLSETDASSVSSDFDRHALKALTVEYQTHNIIVRRIQVGLLLVVVGPSARNSMESFKVTAETLGEATYPAMALVEELTSEKVAEEESEAKHGEGFTALHLQRMKVEKLVEYITAHFGGYVMPDDTHRLATFP